MKAKDTVPLPHGASSLRKQGPRAAGASLRGIAQLDSRFRGNDEEKHSGEGRPLRRLAALLLLAVAMAAPLAACGKKGSLEPPADSEHPRRYPSR